MSGTCRGAAQRGTSCTSATGRAGAAEKRAAVDEPEGVFVHGGILYRKPKELGAKHATPSSACEQCSSAGAEACVAVCQPECTLDLKRQALYNHTMYQARCSLRYGAYDCTPPVWPHPAVVAATCCSQALRYHPYISAPETARAITTPARSPHAAIGAMDGDRCVCSACARLKRPTTQSLGRTCRQPTGRPGTRLRSQMVRRYSQSPDRMWLCVWRWVWGRLL